MRKVEVRVPDSPHQRNGSVRSENFHNLHVSGIAKQTIASDQSEPCIRWRNPTWFRGDSLSRAQKIAVIHQRPVLKLPDLLRRHPVENAVPETDHHVSFARPLRHEPRLGFGAFVQHLPRARHGITSRLRYKNTGPVSQHYEAACGCGILHAEPNKGIHIRRFRNRFFRYFQRFPR